ncbi:hypothetical protein AWI43_32300 [Streptomyces sp. WAC04657]|uniref:hypothetical protein n=1 Tax=unclassified Streptomyces TaxID=2593676 RepID=UPI0007899D53|nr:MULTISPECIES: hypothetical protein [unclassified Streptomyces]KYG51134.1 hypothetical protein AWI43_32300 [Streptomyces sp. WAC04657]
MNAVPELSGVDLARQALLAAREAAKKNGAATLGLIAVFAILGAILALAGMTLGAIVQLLACCAAVGAVTAGAVAGGRRLAALLSSALGNPQ